MHRLRLCLSASLFFACGSEESSEGNGSSSGPSGDPTTMSSTAGESSSSTTPAESSSAAESSSGGGGVECTSNDECDATEYCDFPFDSCGASNSTGTCTIRPTECKPVVRPVCGCGDVLYPGACEAASMGVDLAFLGECELPNGAFACGPSFCILGEEYCAVTAGFEPTAACIELPPACEPPSCTCMTECCGCEGASCCSDYCTGEGDALTFTCPAD